MSDYLSYKATFKNPKNKYLKYFCQHPVSEWSLRKFQKKFKQLKSDIEPLYKKQLLKIKGDSKEIPKEVSNEIDKLLKKLDRKDEAASRSDSPLPTINYISGNNYVVKGDLIINQAPASKKRKIRHDNSNDSQYSF